MASYTQVQDVINIVAAVLLEPYNSGEYPGPSLGIVSMNDLLNVFSDVLEDFVNRSGLVYSIFTQQILAFTPQYQIPENLNEPKAVFVNGIYVDHAAQFDLDQWQYQWEGSSSGTPEFWFMDGLPPKTLQLALTPNYNGASYVVPIGPSATPPFGVTGLFNGATTGQFTGSITVSGTAGAWVSGATFDPNWQNYYPLPNMTIGGTAYPLASVTSSTALVFAIVPGNGTYTWKVNIGQDGNLTIVGTQGLSSMTYALTDLVPVVPDSFCIALSYGILARLLSMDGELKDLQRAYYCQSRYTEFCNLASAVSGEMLIGN